MQHIKLGETVDQDIVQRKQTYLERENRTFSDVQNGSLARQKVVEDLQRVYFLGDTRSFSRLDKASHMLHTPRNPHKVDHSFGHS